MSSINNKNNIINDELYEFVNIMDQPDVAINMLKKSLEGDCVLVDAIARMTRAMENCKSFDDFIERINKSQ